MYWNFGERHEGEWKNDKANGKGIRFFPVVIDMKEILKMMH